MKQNYDVYRLFACFPVSVLGLCAVVPSKVFIATNVKKKRFSSILFFSTLAIIFLNNVRMEEDKEDDILCHKR